MAGFARPSAVYRPDWVMLGVPMERQEGDCRVMVFASQTLTEAEVRAAIEHDFSFDPFRPRNSFLQSYELQVFMRDIQFACGSDYASALQTILRSWSPDASARNNAEGLRNIRPAAISSGPAELMP